MGQWGTAFKIAGVTVLPLIIYLRKYGNMSYDSSRQAGTEKIEEIEPIEITPEMIEAAVYELKYGEAREPSDIARAIYVAMVTEDRLSRRK
jgi:hypothetical protein